MPRFDGEKNTLDPVPQYMLMQGNGLRAFLLKNVNEKLPQNLSIFSLIFD